MSGIIFLHHADSKDDEVRRHVRSRAAQHSHRFGPRKPKAKNGKSKRATQSNHLEPGPSLSRRGSSLSIAASATSASTGVTTEGDEQHEDEKSLPRTLIQGKPAISRLGSYADEPFDSYPVPKQEWFGEAIDYMNHFMRRGWSSLQATIAEQDEAMLWVKRVTMNEPAYFYMNMLSLMGDLVSRGQRDAKLLVWLTGQVVASINEALGDPVKSLAVGTILTVGRLALREIVVGDVNAGITYHRPAFARMLVMAGNVQALNLPPLVRSHLAWSDRLMTRKTGIKMSQIEPALANEPIFEGGIPDAKADDDTKVLDSYLPHRTRQPGSPQRHVKSAKRTEEGR